VDNLKQHSFQLHTLQFQITDIEFYLFKSFIYDYAGIILSDEKKSLVSSRLSKRLRHYSLSSFQDYFDFMIVSPREGERQVALDLLTTNETYFFREPRHFDFLEKGIIPKWKGGKTFRVWSAASSTGEEAYSIAMLLDDYMGNYPWEVFGSDISSRVLKTANQGHYLQNRIDGIPKNYLHKYCLKGVGEQVGTLLIDKKLRNKVSFSSINLKAPLGNYGPFQVIFLRNVLIYFDLQTKKQVVKQIIGKLDKGGYLFIGHTDSLMGINHGLDSVSPSIFQSMK